MAKPPGRQGAGSGGAPGVHGPGGFAAARPRADGPTACAPGSPGSAATAAAVPAPSAAPAIPDRVPVAPAARDTPAAEPGTGPGPDPGAGGLSPQSLAARVKATGRRLGFDLVAIGPADPPARGPAFAAWLEAGYAGTMAYLARTRERRLDPRQVLPGARSVIACALNYYQGEQTTGPTHVARYAWGADYHAVMEPRLRTLLADLQAAAPGTAGRAYVDTGPVLERDLAARAGLGWIGKNTMLLHPALGSYFFIGVILTTAELAFDPPLPDRCGTCRRCLDACPTGAFPAPRVLDARRCIAYLTIEHRGPIPEALRPALGTLAFGCDICQAVCPWNGRAPLAAEAAFAAGALPTLAELATLSEEAYRVRLRGSPLRRARRAGLARNAAVALGNRRDPRAVPVLAAALADPDPDVRAHAAWALGRIGGPEAEAALAAARARAEDGGTRAALEAALEAARGRPAAAGVSGQGPASNGREG